MKSELVIVGHSVGQAVGQKDGHDVGHAVGHEDEQDVRHGQVVVA